MVYTTAYDKNKNPVSYLVTSDYKFDQKEWVPADTIRFVSSNYGKVTVSVSGNQYTWVNSSPEDTKATLISGQYTNSYVPVLEQKTVSGYLWYKVPVNLSGNSNIYGWTLAQAPGVSVELLNYQAKNNTPVIIASDKTLVQGTSFNPLEGVSATDTEDGNITSSIKVEQNNVDVNKVGTYQVVYKVTDSANDSTTKTITVTVTENKKPEITASDITTTLGKTKPNLLDGVTAIDVEDGDLTKEVTADDSKVSYDKVGEYPITYTVKDKFGNVTTKEVKLIIKDNLEPVIYASNKTITIGSEFKEKDGITAIDEEDGDITKNIKVIENTVNTEKIGAYQVTYQVIDNNNHTVEKTIKVEVVNKIQKEGTFYFDYLKDVNNKLQFRGYLTISGMNNTLNEEITYKLIFTNKEDKTKVYEQEAKRITDLTGINRPISSTDGYKYTHSWFVIDIDIDNLPIGDYTVEVQAESKSTFSKALVNNKLFKTEVTSYSSNNKKVNIKNNYSDGTSAVTLYIRDNDTPLKTVGSYYNQYDVWRTFEFVDNKLHLKGVSYSYGMNLSKTSSVERTIIFENKATYKTYKYNLGSITDGLYKVALPTDDNLDKTRAWYDSTIDISKLPKGDYNIYITTKSNLIDISEFTDNLGRDLSSKKITIDGKNYQFKLNLNNGNCIELKVA